MAAPKFWLERQFWADDFINLEHLADNILDDIGIPDGGGARSATYKYLLRLMREHSDFDMYELKEKAVSFYKGYIQAIAESPVSLDEWLQNALMRKNKNREMLPIRNPQFLANKSDPETYKSLKEIQ